LTSRKSYQLRRLVAALFAAFEKNVIDRAPIDP